MAKETVKTETRGGQNKMKLTPAKSPCNTCGLPISWDQNLREQLNWRGPLNLDGSQHRHNQQQNTITTTTTRDEDNSMSLEESKQQAVLAVDERRNAIQKAHDENMESSEKLRHAIDGLTLQVEKFNRLIAEYLGITK